MSDGRSTISGGRSYEEIGAYWDKHDLGAHWNETREAEFHVNIGSQTTYYAVDRVLSERPTVLAGQRGISPQTLLNLWLQEHIVGNEQ